MEKSIFMGMTFSHIPQEEMTLERYIENYKDFRSRCNRNAEETIETQSIDDTCENSQYLQMVESIANFVIKAAEKDNPTAAELNAMVEMSKMLFRTL